MIASVGPRTSHGEQLQRLFCYDVEHPACLGRKSAAKVLLEYTEKYIHTYRQAGTPWAAFVHFVDSHEDSQDLAAAIDLPLTRFLTSVHPQIEENTIVAVTSDHGMHYGPYFTTEAGRRERAQPVLHMRLPRTGPQLLPRNREMRVTPFDLHETLAELLGVSPGSSEQGSSGYGISLLHALPWVRSCAASGIPQSLCADTSPVYAVHRAACVSLPTVPSLFSFYQDMVPEHKPKIYCSSKLDAFSPRSKLVTQSAGGAVLRMPRQRAAELSCKCASQRVPWRPCLSGASADSVADAEGLVDTMTLAEDDAFALVKCGPPSPRGGFDVHHHSVQPRPHQTSAAEPNAAQPSEGSASHIDSPIGSRTGADAPPLDVLVIEVDSLSRASAHRHLPRVMELLETHPTIQASFVDVEFDILGVAGSNSIPNQAAMLAGCTAVFGNASSSPEPFHQVAASTIGGWRLWCPRSDRASGANGPRVPWLFSIAKQFGYATFFGEEICAEGEPMP